MVGCKTQPLKSDKDVVFAELPWDDSSPAWQEIDRRLPDSHLAREIDAVVDQLDLSKLLNSYSGRGSPPLRPDIMLKFVLYEFACGYTSPADWFRHTRESDAVKWLSRGLQPSRGVCYGFAQRLAPFLEDWNREVLQQALDHRHITASRGALDGTAIAACASRHKVIRQKTLDRRLQELDEALAADEAGQSPEHPPRWMARHPQTRRTQRERYERARKRMEELQERNRQRRSGKRSDPERIVVSPTDPDAGLGRDKFNVFRPLYTAVMMQDLDSPFVLGLAVFNRAGDCGTLPKVVESMAEWTARKPEVLLADATFAAVADLQFCEQQGITLYAPVSENDYSQKNERKPGTNQFTGLPKTEFTWLAEKETYRCPAGHLLVYEGRSQSARAEGQSIGSIRFRCPPEYCCACPRQTQCTRAPMKGRTVSRLDGEELLDELRVRMQTTEAKALYRLRSQHVELRFADLKEHRCLRQFTARGLTQATAQLATAVLVHNGLTLHRKQLTKNRARHGTRILEKIPA